MSKQTTRSTGKSIGFVSEREIDIWSSKGRKKAKLYHSSLSNNSPLPKRSKNINNQQQLQMTFSTSINRLREKTRSQKSLSSSLSNRMNYLQVDLQRKKQMLEIAKNKYQKMMQARNQSIIEKKVLTKNIQKFNREHQRTVSLKASRIKMDREKGALSTSVWIRNNHEQAIKIKQSRFINQKAIAYRQQMEVNKKRQIVQKSHHVMEASRKKMREDHHRIIDQGRKQHNVKLFEQYLKAEMQKRSNIQLIKQVEDKMNMIAEAKIKYCRELQQYESELRPKGKEDCLLITH